MLPSVLRIHVLVYQAFGSTILLLFAPFTAAALRTRVHSIRRIPRLVENLFIAKPVNYVRVRSRAIMDRQKETLIDELELEVLPVGNQIAIALYAWRESRGNGNVRSRFVQ